MIALFWISVLAVFYSYFGYPLALWALIKLRPRHSALGNGALGHGALASDTTTAVSVTVIVTARNEERVIQEKLENTLSLRLFGEPVERAGVQIIVASDASEDGTDAVVRSYANRGVELVRLEVRGGKERAQQAAVAAARGAIVVFTDAKIRLQPDAVEAFVRCFADSSVGAVSSVDRVESEDGEGSGEGMYVRYEMWLRSLESEFGSLVGVSGSCFAVRREISAELRADIPSDFALLLAAQRRGLRGVHAPEIVATYRAVATEREEFQRKVRTVLRGITTLRACSEVLDPRRYGVFAWQVASHKLMRWLVPLFLVTGTISTFALAEHSTFFGWLAFGLLLFYVAAGLAAADPKLRSHVYFRLPLFFLVVNAGIFIAWIRFLKGQRTVAWNPSAKG